jgi:hypothetical protein
VSTRSSFLLFCFLFLYCFLFSSFFSYPFSLPFSLSPSISPSLSLSLSPSIPFFLSSSSSSSRPYSHFSYISSPTSFLPLSLSSFLSHLFFTSIFPFLLCFPFSSFLFCCSTFYSLFSFYLYFSHFSFCLFCFWCHFPFHLFFPLIFSYFIHTLLYFSYFLIFLFPSSLLFSFLFLLFLSSLSFSLPLFRLQPEALNLSTQLPMSGIDVTLYTFNSSLLSTKFYQPQYPVKNICTEYASKCASLIAVANQSALIPQCDSTVPYTGINRFPVSGARQVVNVAYLPLTPKNISQPTVKKPVLFTTSPNPFYASNDMGYHTQCPEGESTDTILCDITLYLFYD